MDFLWVYGFAGLNWFAFTACVYRETVTRQYKYLCRYFWLCMLFWPWIVMQMFLAEMKKDEN